MPAAALVGVPGAAVGAHFAVPAQYRYPPAMHLPYTCRPARRRSPAPDPKPFDRRRLLAFVLAPALALAAGSCSKKMGGPGGAGGFQMPPSPVEVADVHAQTVRDRFHALGSLEATENIQVVGELNAKVKQIRFAEGQPVAAGATLVELDDREIRAEAERAAATREQAKVNFQRASKLSEQQLVSAQQLDDARTALKVAEADEALARARLDKTRIRAPWAGIIGRRKISPGAYIRSGDVIAELARVDEMKVEFAAPERYTGEIRNGVAVELTTPAFPNQTFHGHVTVVDPIVDPEARAVQLVARVANSDRKLKPGMSANVTVTLAERGNALMVPDEAVFSEGGQNFVYVVNPNSTVTRTPVELGARDSANVEVTRGLTDGARVVQAGHQKLYDGAHVMPVSSLAALQAPGGPGAGGSADPAGAHARAGSAPAGGAGREGGAKGSKPGRQGGAGQRTGTTR